MVAGVHVLREALQAGDGLFGGKVDLVLSCWRSRDVSNFIFNCRRLTALRGSDPGFFDSDLGRVCLGNVGCVS